MQQRRQRVDEDQERAAEMDESGDSPLVDDQTWLRVVNIRVFSAIKILVRAEKRRAEPCRMSLNSALSILRWMITQPLCSLPFLRESVDHIHATDE